MSWKSYDSCLVMIIPAVKLRQQIKKLFHVIDLPFPNESQLFAMVEKVADGARVLDRESKEVQVATNQASAEAMRGPMEFDRGKKQRVTRMEFSLESEASL